MNQYPDYETIKTELQTRGLTEEEINDSFVFAAHEFMRESENIFRPMPRRITPSPDTVKTFFLRLKRTSIALKSPVRGKCTYSEYLGSYYWRMLSMYYRLYVTEKCSICGSKNDLQVHHKAYKNKDGKAVFGAEYLVIGTEEDCLTTLCEECHKKHHGI